MRRYFCILTVVLSIILTVGCQHQEKAERQAAVSPEKTACPVPVAPDTSGQTYGISVEGDQKITLHAKVEPLVGDDLSSVAQTDEILLLANFHPATPKDSYKASKFEPLFPKKAVRVGEVWQLPADSMEPFLMQFHGSATESLNMDGSGSYGLLRAVSADYFDVRFRTHAQFELAPQIFMSPGQFAGRAIINRKTKSIEYFSLEVPTTNKLNVNFEVLKNDFVVGMVYTPEFKLASEKEPAIASWDAGIDEKKSAQLLKSKFFAFEQIEWLPLDQAIKRSEETKKPVFAIVIAGVLDDESC